MTDTTYVDIDNSRLDEQRQVMNKIIDNAECPFCAENLRKYHKEPIIKDGKYWIVTPNQWPYENTILHYLAIYKSHTETLSDLDPAAGEELLRFFSEIQQEKKHSGWWDGHAVWRHKFVRWHRQTHARDVDLAGPG